MVDIEVHIDTLKYTRDGLQTREPLPLTLGQHHRVVLVRPQRRPAVAASYGGFLPNSSFPGPAVLSLLLHNHAAPGGTLNLAARLEGHKCQLFAHADTSGSEDHNKELTDRRATCVEALLLRDVERFTKAASEEQWGLDVEQVMLRALACDPGPIDGKSGDLSDAAVLMFQKRYRERVYHKLNEPLVLPALEPDGKLGPQTHEALLDAYVSRFSPRLMPESFVDKATANGCGFHNRATVQGGAENRRVSLVVHPGPIAYPEAIPCVDGDAAACPAVGDDAAHACLWYREHVKEERFENALHHHFLPSWLKLKNGNYMLSVLTTVPDAETVEFQVYAAREHWDDVAAPDPSYDLKELGDSISSHPIQGVAQVVWVPPQGFTPDSEGWVEDEASGRLAPIFRVLHPGSNTQLYHSYPSLLPAIYDVDVQVYGHWHRNPAAHERYRLEGPLPGLLFAREGSTDGDGVVHEKLLPRGHYELTVDGRVVVVVAHPVGFVDPARSDIGTEGRTVVRIRGLHGLPLYPEQDDLGPDAWRVPLVNTEDFPDIGDESEAGHFDTDPNDPPEDTNDDDDPNDDDGEV